MQKVVRRERLSRHDPSEFIMTLGCGREGLLSPSPRNRTSVVSLLPVNPP